ncbi:TPA: hypothetical protein ACPUS8_005668 [Klebsiella pneumoniae]|uniref:hypothetical protein n=1 Tax=Klebsiella pneumoniae TaxID=573 RepID=UPI0010DBD870|nr:hypothetical protein [Klebsiella pneumoniae]VGK23079.1 Sea24 [Klebsiella pneumoniae]HBS3889443.1 hypothetical protein [Klebsiella pneumoniae]
MPKRRAQARVQEQLKVINPVLANPEEFRVSLKRQPPALFCFFTFSSVMEFKLLKTRQLVL